MNRLKFEGEEYTALRKQIIADLIELGYIEANPKRWVRPVYEDVENRFVSNMVPRSNIEMDACKAMAKKFFNHWESVDWYTKGKVRIKSVNGRIATWIGNNYDKNTGSNGTKNRKLSVAEQVAEGIASRENENAAEPEMFGQIVADYG